MDQSWLTSIGHDLTGDADDNVIFLCQRYQHAISKLGLQFQVIDQDR